MRSVGVAVAAVVALVAVVAAGPRGAGALESRAWQDYTFPEMQDETFMERTENVGLSFSGGGARSYLASMGYLMGLHQLGLMDKVRYIAGISGGSWATGVYSFVQHGASATALNEDGDPVEITTAETDDAFLCVDQYRAPADITEDQLEEMALTCARSFPIAEPVRVGAAAYKDDENTDVQDVYQLWGYGIEAVYTVPAGISSSAPFSWSQESVDDIKARNPELADVEFVTPAANRPFPIIGAALMGPTSCEQLDADTFNFTLIEATPLAVGEPFTHTVHFTNKDSTCDVDLTVGGYVEPFAYGASSAPASGLDMDSTSGTVDTSLPSNYLTVGASMSASSWAPGAFFSTMAGELPTTLGMPTQYWSVSDAKPESTEFWVADGGDYVDMNPISLIQRGVDRIVLFLNFKTPLQPAENWDPRTDPYEKEDVDFTFSALFGVIPEDYSTFDSRAFFVDYDQVWSSDDWADVIVGMQTAQQDGNGIIYRRTMTTVANDWWGLPAGMETDVTFVHLGRLPGWEDQLPDDVHDACVPRRNSDDLSNLKSTGDYRNFPHYSTTGGGIEANAANLLSDLTAWSVLENADLFTDIING